MVNASPQAQPGRTASPQPLAEFPGSGVSPATIAVPSTISTSTITKPETTEQPGNSSAIGTLESFTSSSSSSEPVSQPTPVPGFSSSPDTGSNFNINNSSDSQGNLSRTSNLSFALEPPARAPGHISSTTQDTGLQGAGSHQQPPTLHDLVDGQSQLSPQPHPQMRLQHQPQPEPQPQLQELIQEHSVTPQIVASQPPQPDEPQVVAPQLPQTDQPQPAQVQSEVPQESKAQKFISQPISKVNQLFSKLKSKKAVTIIVAAVVLLSAVALVPQLLKLSGGSQQASKLTTEFVTSLANNDFDRAYSLLSPRSGITRGDFDEKIGVLQETSRGFKKQKMTEFGFESNLGEEALYTYVGSAVYEDGSEGAIEASLIKEDGEYKIVGISMTKDSE